MRMSMCRCACVFVNKHKPVVHTHVYMCTVTRMYVHICLESFLNWATVFVLSYEPNGELWTYIRRLSAFDMKSTKFYTSEIVLALEHLHGLNIVHR